MQLYYPSKQVMGLTMTYSNVFFFSAVFGRTYGPYPVWLGLLWREFMRTSSGKNQGNLVCHNAPMLDINFFEHL